MASRTSVVLAGLCVAAACLGSSPASAASPAPGHPVRIQRGLNTPGSPVWVKRYKAPWNGEIYAAATAVSPDESVVFVTGARTHYNQVSGWNYLTMAYDTSSGSLLWAARYEGPGHGPDTAADLVVSPDGSTVFVTGSSQGTNTGYDVTTIAYDASTGSESWIARYDGLAHDDDNGNAIGMSPDGATVFVTGSSGQYRAADFVSVAYDASTGSQRWVKLYKGPGSGADVADAIGVSPDGSKVFVTGSSVGSFDDYATVAYDASSGTRLWAARYDGPGHLLDEPSALGVSPDGTTVFVTGRSLAKSATLTRTTDIATVAYDASTGATLWVGRFDGPRRGNDSGNALAVSPNGTSVFVTGASCSSRWQEHDCDYVTLAYTATGSEQWVQSYDGPIHGHDAATALGVSPDGSTIFVTGQSAGQARMASVSWTFNDYATIAYDAATGEQYWAKRYNSRADNFDDATALAVSPDGSKLFVTGYSQGRMVEADATVAYTT